MFSIKILTISLVTSTIPLTSGRSFSIDHERNCFLKDGEPFRYISGSIHYFRIPPPYWEDRLLKAKMLGLNAIQTYIAWNLHEPSPGVYDFEGGRNIFQFLEIAQSLDLLVILRPGPYIDAEVDFGGFPWWLAKDPSIKMRSVKDHRYINAVSSWFTSIMTRLRPFLYTNGGPIVSVQVENEYGNFIDCDYEYMEFLASLLRSLVGEDVVLFTTDGYKDDELKCGTIPSVYSTIDFGTEIDPKLAFAQMRKFQKTGPLVNSEYYTGWLDYWGRPHQTREPTLIARHLDSILALNASVNMYMLIGGTNIGFINGADLDPGFLPIPTSYDYDAPLSEAGDPTEKYQLIRDVIKNYAPLPSGPVPPATKKTAYGRFPVSDIISLKFMLEFLYPQGPKHTSEYPSSMENIGQGYGYTLYRTDVPGKSKHRRNKLRLLHVETLHDRGIVMLDVTETSTNVQGVISRDGNTSLLINSTGSVLHILVENQGRICSAPKTVDYLPDSKGILSNVTLDDEILKNWKYFSIDDKFFVNAMKNLLMPLGAKGHTGATLRPSLLASSSEPPAFFAVYFHVDLLADTYLKLEGWGKGQVLLNMFDIGKYWQTLGPQLTLFVPKFALQLGVNYLLLFELERSPCHSLSLPGCAIEFVDKPVFI